MSEPIIFELGHNTLRVGFAGGVIPSYEFPSVIGVAPDTPNNPDNPKKTSESLYFTGYEAMQTPRVSMNILSVFDMNGDVSDWEIFDTFFELSCGAHFPNRSSERPVMWIEPPWYGKKHRAKLIELLFEMYHIPYMYFDNSAVLAAYANNVETAGIVVDSGAMFTCVSCVRDGMCLRNTITRTIAAGDLLNKQCDYVLAERRIPVVEPYRVNKISRVAIDEPPLWTEKPDLPQVTDTFREFTRKEVVERFKMSVLQVSAEPLSEGSSEDTFEEVIYRFPSGNRHKFGRERFEIAETLFNTSFMKAVEANAAGMISVKEAVGNTLFSVDRESRTDFLKHVVVTGGTSAIYGFPERLQMELKGYFRRCPKLDVRHLARQYRRHSSFIGASMYAANADISETWVSSSEYHEKGPQVFAVKCP